MPGVTKVRLAVLPENICRNMLSTIFLLFPTCTTWSFLNYFLLLWWVPRTIGGDIRHSKRFHDNSSTDISSTTLRLQTFRLDISSTTVYEQVAQLYIQLLFQQIIIFINSNFYLHCDSFFQSHLHCTDTIDNTTYTVSKHCGMTIQLVLSAKQAYFHQSHFKLGRISCINPAYADIVFVSSFQLLFQQGKS